MLYRAAAVLSVIAITNPACTVIYQIVPVEETTGEASSWPPAASSTSEPQQDSSSSSSSTSTSESADETSTGGVEVEDSSTSTGDAADSTSTGSTSDAGTSSGTSSSTGEQGSTLDTTGSESSSSTGEPEPIGLPLGAVCLADDECKSGACIGGLFNGDVSRCSIACSVETATDCVNKGYPGGFCAWGGGEQRWCSGAPSNNNTTFEKATPPLPGPDYFHTSGTINSPDQRRAFLIPAWETEFKVETSMINGNGFGPWVYDIYSSQGALLSTHIVGEDMPVIEPSGVEQYHWLVMRTAAGVNASYYHLFLKNPYWPNANP